MLRGEITSALDRQLVGEALTMVGLLAEQGMTLLLGQARDEPAALSGRPRACMHAGRIHETAAPPQRFAAPQTAELQQAPSALHAATRPRFLRWLNEHGLYFVQHRG